MQNVPYVSRAEVLVCDENERAAAVLHMIARACGANRNWPEGMTVEQAGAAMARALLQTCQRPKDLIGEFLKGFYKMEFCTDDRLLTCLRGSVRDQDLDIVI